MKLLIICLTVFNLAFAKRYVVLNYPLGSGHQSLTNGIVELIRKKDPQAEIAVRDIRDFRNSPLIVQKAQEQEYLKTIQAGPENDYGHGFEEFLQKDLTPAPYDDSLGLYIESEKVDVVIATHFDVAQHLSGHRGQGQLQNTELFWMFPDYYQGKLPDFTNKLDGVFVGSTSLAESWKLQNPNGNIYAAGLPLSQMAQNIAVTPKETLRNELQFGAEKVVVLGGGGEGLFSYEESLKSLKANSSGTPTQVVLFTGKNEKVRQKLVDLSGRLMDSNFNVRIFGEVPQDYFLKNVKASDVFITKPGGMSITEASYFQTPTILVDTIGGHEKHNKNYFTSQNLATSLNNPSDIGPYVNWLWNNPEGQSLIAQMGAAQAEYAQSFNPEFIGNVLVQRPANIFDRDIPGIQQRNAEVSFYRFDHEEGVKKIFNGEVDEGIAYLERGVSAYQKNPQLYADLAMGYRYKTATVNNSAVVKGLLEKSAQNLEKAVALNPRDPAYTYELAQTYARLESVEESSEGKELAVKKQKDLYAQTIENSPMTMGAYQNLSQLKLRENKANEAVGTYTLGIEKLSKFLPHDHEYISELKFQRGNLLLQLAEENPQSSQILRDRALKDFSAISFGKGESSLDDILKLPKTNNVACAHEEESWDSIQADIALAKKLNSDMKTYQPKACPMQTLDENEVIRKLKNVVSQLRVARCYEDKSSVFNELDHTLASMHEEAQRGFWLKWIQNGYAGSQPRMVFTPYTVRKRFRAHDKKDKIRSTGAITTQVQVDGNAGKAAKVLEQLQEVVEDPECLKDIQKLRLGSFIGDAITGFSQFGLFSFSPFGALASVSGKAIGAAIKIADTLLTPEYDWTNPQDRKEFVNMNCAFYDLRQEIYKSGLSNIVGNFRQEDHDEVSGAISRIEKNYEVFMSSMNHRKADLNAEKQKILKAQLGAQRVQKMRDLKIILEEGRLQNVDFQSLDDRRDILKSLTTISRWIGTDHDFVDVEAGNVNPLVSLLQFNNRALKGHFDNLIGQLHPERLHLLHTQDTGYLYQRVYRPINFYLNKVQDNYKKDTQRVVNAWKAMTNPEDNGKTNGEALKDVRFYSERTDIDIPYALDTLHTRKAKIEKSLDATVYSREGVHDQFEILRKHGLMTRRVVGYNGHEFLKYLTKQGKKDQKKFRKRFNAFNDVFLKPGVAFDITQGCFEANMLKTMYKKSETSLEMAYDYLHTNKDLLSTRAKKHHSIGDLKFGTSYIEQNRQELEMSDEANKFLQSGAKPGVKIKDDSLGELMIKNRELRDNAGQVSRFMLDNDC